MMNCRACRMQLPEGASNCPQCGALTPYSYSAAGLGPTDPTEVPSPDAVAVPPPPPMLYESPSHGSVPITPYDLSPYGAAPPSPYEPPVSQSPYDPYNSVAPAPRSPLPQRPGNRIGILVGVILLVLLLIGGGVLVWLQSSAARNGAATAARATATAQANTTVTATAAVQHFTAKGTFTILSRANTRVRQDGQNKIYSYTQQGVDSGDITGSYTQEETSIVHPDNTANFSGTSTCTCTVAGKSGTLMYSYSGTSTANGSFQGQTFDGHGTGDLAKLHGQGVFQGQGTHGTYSSEEYFDSGS